MSQVALPEAFTPDELAQAAGVARGTVEALVASGELRPISGTTFISTADAIRVGRRLRTDAASRPVPAPSGILAAANGDAGPAERRVGLPAFASSLVHA